MTITILNFVMSLPLPLKKGEGRGEGFHDVHHYAIAAILLASSLHTAQAQSQILIDLTNQIWRYNQTEDLTGTGWQLPDYDDRNWPQGSSVLAWETISTVTRFTNTALTLGRMTYYFRTRFNFTGDASGTVLLASNLIDDGYVMYLNGSEVARFNMPDGPPSYDTPADFANPRGEGNFATQELPLNSLRYGDNLLAVEVHQSAPDSPDIVWGSVLHAVPAAAPRFASPANDLALELLQGRSTNLSVVVQGLPTPTVQWFHDSDPIPGATSSVLRLSNMSFANQGIYYCEAASSLGSALSSAFDVRYVPDDVPPNLLFATVHTPDFSTLILHFDESITGALDPWSYEIHSSFGGIAAGVANIRYNSASNQVHLSLDPPLDPGERYQLYISQTAAIQDHFDNPLSNPRWGTPILVPHVFVNGHNGYLGTKDIEIHEGSSADQPNANSSQITVDLDNNGQAQGLLRFDDLFGLRDNQLSRCAAFIHGAWLRLYTANPGSPARLLRLLVPWSESDTWNSLQNGIDQINGLEAAETGVIISPDQLNEYIFVDVTSTLRSWMERPTANHGWAFISMGPDGYNWASSDNPNVTLRPQLLVTYSMANSGCSIWDQPQSKSLLEGTPLLLDIGASGYGITYQWYQNNEPITGATNYSYFVEQTTLAHSGLYHVVLRSTCYNDTCTSDAATVTVIARCPPDLRITQNPDRTVTVSHSRCAGYLFQAETLEGPWVQLLSDTNRFTFSTSSNSRFFRLVP